MNRKRIIIALFSVLGVILIWDSVFTWNYVRSINLGIVLPGLLGLLLISIVLKMVLVEGPIIKSRRLRSLIRWALIICMIFFILIEGLIIADPYLHRAELAEGWITCLFWDVAYGLMADPPLL